ncbi:MAG: VWA domain-containing protein [Coriobacteriales bacterium]|jgi:hypothetical protein|nr:VWA domain-containing protein [Coriobacteriales bacterium]
MTTNERNATVPVAITQKQQRRLKATTGHIVLALLLTISMLLLPFEGAQVAYAASKPIDVVLLLDASASMEGQALRQERDAAKQIVEKAMAQNSDMRVAVICFAGGTNLVAGFDSSLSEKKSAIDSFAMEGSGTNLTDAFKLANLILADFARPEAEKTVLVMSDGIPTVGESVNSSEKNLRYTADVHGSSYRYGCKAYQTWETELATYKVVSLRFVPSGTIDDVKDLVLGKALMDDIGNSGSFVVESTSALAGVAEQAANFINTGDTSRSLGPVKISVEYHSDLTNSDKTLNLIWDPTEYLAHTTSYNHELAKVAMTLCAKSYQGQDKTILEAFGYSEGFEFFDVDDAFFPNDTVHYSVAYQKIDDVIYLAVLAHGTTGDDEWTSDFSSEFGSSGISVDFSTAWNGFELAAVDMETKLFAYASDKDFDLASAEVLLTGHSRGAAAVDILAARLTKRFGEANISAYTFATPNTYVKKTAPVCANIFNICDSGDVVTLLPPAGDKSGMTYRYATDRMAVKNYYGVLALANGSIGAEDFFWTHTPENYIARVFSEEPILRWLQDWLRVFIHCPTDVSIEMDGTTVVSIVDNQVDTNSQYPAFTNEQGEKTVYLSADQAYALTVTGTEDGEMAYSVERFGSDGVETVIDTTTIAFVKGDQFTAQIGEGSADYQLMPIVKSPTEKISEALASMGLSVETLLMIVVGLIVLVVPIAIVIAAMVTKTRGTDI